MRNVSKKRKVAGKQGVIHRNLMGVPRKDEDGPYFRQEGSPLLVAGTQGSGKVQHCHCLPQTFLALL